MFRRQKSTEGYTALLTGALASALLFSPSGLKAEEWTQNTLQYENDGWLDITEWFDGNDYNPTDEAWWRWDDETYEAAEDTSGDIDNAWYGYNHGHHQGWFYDYYDPYWYYGYPVSNVYPYGSRYYDYDNDGSYDAYASYSDWNLDGDYDSYTYYALNSDAGSKQQQARAKAEAPSDSKAQNISGSIQRLKDVQTRESPHTVVSIKAQDKTVIADLGKAEDVKSLGLKAGDQITVKGPVTKVDSKSVVLAQSFAVNGKNHDVTRQRRQITAKVLDTRKVKVRGGENLIAIVQGKDKDSKMAVDLGRADKLGLDLVKGKELTFSGVPVKVKGKRLVLAQTVMKGGKSVPVERAAPEAKP